MKKTLLPCVEELTWKDARKYAEKGCQELFAILDEINPSDEYTFIRVRYPFGALIMHNDSIYIPINENDNHSVPLSDPEIPQTLKEKLGYRSIAFGMITKNPIEVYREIEDRVFSIELSGPNKGIEIGIFEYFGLTPCFSVSSGARSLFMIPKISETRHHKKLMKRYQINSAPPKNIFKQWHVFKSLYNSQKFDEKWESEILYLTRPWDEGLEKHKNSRGWEKLKAYLYKKGFEHSELGRKKLILDVLWQKLVVALHEEGFKPDIYTSDTLKHIIYIFLGGVAGSRPFVDNYGGPITELQKIYVEEYGLTQTPTIMGPMRFSLQDNIPVYYSMQFPTMISANPSIRKTQTIIEEMRELMMLKSTLARIEGNTLLNGIKLHEIVQSLKLEFFHGDLYSYGKQIRPTKEIPLRDSDYLSSSIKNQELNFADNGSFIRGCVKISRHKSE